MPSIFVAYHIHDNISDSNADNAIHLVKNDRPLYATCWLVIDICADQLLRPVTSASTILYGIIWYYYVIRYLRRKLVIYKVRIPIREHIFGL